MAKTSVVERQQWQALVEHTDPLSVSIYMPTHPAGADMRQDPIRLRNLLDKSEQQLIAMGMRTPIAADRLKQARAFLLDSDFWRHQGRGLALFAADGIFETHVLPFEPQEIVAVADHFYLKPMFALQAGQRFYILSLSKNAVRLYRCDRQEIEPVDLPGAPASFAEHTRVYEPEESLQWHTETAGHVPGGSRPAAFHGQADGGDQSIDKRRAMEYCHEIDVALNRVLSQERAPLLLAAAEPLSGFYRRLSNYPTIYPRTLEGCPDIAGAKDLHSRAWQILEENNKAPLRQAADRYYVATNAGQGSNDLLEILSTASIGGVDTLFVAGDEHCWGLYDFGAGSITRHDAQQPGDADLLNLAAVLAHRNGASVHVVPRSQVPGDMPAAAAFRFVMKT